MPETTPTFVIHLGERPWKTRITCNGADISSSITALNIRHQANSLQIVTLELNPTSLQILSSSPDPDSAPLGTSSNRPQRLDADAATHLDPSD
jgi:hypothetical protein